MSSVFLNFTILGRNSFEVFPHHVRANDVHIETLLGQVSSEQEIFYLRRHIEFWLVCHVSTLNLGPMDG